MAVFSFLKNASASSGRPLVAQVNDWGGSVAWFEPGVVGATAVVSVGKEQQGVRLVCGREVQCRHQCRREESGILD